MQTTVEWVLYAMVLMFTIILDSFDLNSKPPRIKPSQEQILRMHTFTNMQMFENIPIFVCFGFSRNFLVHRISHKISAVYVIGFRELSTI